MVHHATRPIPLVELLAELIGKPEATVTFSAGTSFDDVLQKSMDKLGSNGLCFPIASRTEAVLERCEKKVAIIFTVSPLYHHSFYCLAHVDSFNILGPERENSAH